MCFGFVKDVQALILKAGPSNFAQRLHRSSANLFGTIMND